MSSTITLTSVDQATVTETFSGALAGNPDVAFGALNESQTLTAASAPPVTKHATFEQALTAGTATIDLTALPGRTVDETIDGTGLKVQLLRVRAKSTNANVISIAKGASNGYGLDAGGAAWDVTLSPGQRARFDLDDAAPDVAAGAKDLDLAGTGAQILEVEIVLG